MTHVRTWKIIGSEKPDGGIKILAESSDGTGKYIALAGPVTASMLASGLRCLADTVDRDQVFLASIK